MVFPSGQDNDRPWLLAGYLIIFAAFACSGLTRARPRSRMAAGAVAGVILCVLTIATFAAVDNVFVQIVSQQQAKITGFGESGMTSMRAYINSGLVPAGIFFSIEFAVFGTLLAAAGGDLYDHRAPPAGVIIPMPTPHRKPARAPDDAYEQTCRSAHRYAHGQRAHFGTNGRPGTVGEASPQCVAGYRWDEGSRSVPGQVEGPKRNRQRKVEGRSL